MTTQDADISLRNGAGTELVALNGTREAALSVEDVDCVIAARRRLEIGLKTRGPQAGDVVVAKGPSKTYDKARIQDGRKAWGQTGFALCTQPSAPHVHRDGDPSTCSMSGGYWMTAPADRLKDTGRTERALFWSFTTEVGAHRGTNFYANVRVWEFESEEIY